MANLYILVNLLICLVYFDLPPKTLCVNGQCCFYNCIFFIILNFWHGFTFLLLCIFGTVLLLRFQYCFAFPLLFTLWYDLILPLLPISVWSNPAVIIQFWCSFTFLELSNFGMVSPFYNSLILIWFHPSDFYTIPPLHYFLVWFNSTIAFNFSMVSSYH